MKLLVRSIFLLSLSLLCLNFGIRNNAFSISLTGTGFGHHSESDKTALSVLADYGRTYLDESLSVEAGQNLFAENLPEENDETLASGRSLDGKPLSGLYPGHAALTQAFFTLVFCAWPSATLLRGARAFSILASSRRYAFLRVYRI
ncbi:MAG: hypothetical protein INR69_08230 [Mucilaginibacter polytrichastri]|nr:hypothetical protein [Mucilaginibacter polytrichastri]